MGGWFANEAPRLHGRLDEDEHGAGRRELIEYIERKGGYMTARMLKQNLAKYRSMDTSSIKLMLDELVIKGYARHEDSGIRLYDCQRQHQQ